MPKGARDHGSERDGVSWDKPRADWPAGKERGGAEQLTKRVALPVSLVAVSKVWGLICGNN